MEEVNILKAIIFPELVLKEIDSIHFYIQGMGFPGGMSAKDPTCQCRR